MKPGFELDKLIAIHVMNYVVVAKDGWVYTKEGGTFPMPCYSGDLVSSFQIVKESNACFELVYEPIKNLWLARFNIFENFISGETAPHAICLAAIESLKSKGLL